MSVLQELLRALPGEQSTAFPLHFHYRLLSLNHAFHCGLSFKLSKTVPCVAACPFFKNWFSLGPNIKFFAHHNVTGLFEEGDHSSVGSDMSK